MSKSSNNTVNSIPYIFDRPCEPLFTGRNDVTFDVPTDFWPDRYKGLSSSIQTRFPATGQVVRVSKFTGRAPDLSEVTAIDRRSNFSIFNSRDRKCATKLLEILMKAPNVDQFLSTCVYARERVNPYVFVYATSVAILHRSDTQNVPLPSHAQMFPKLYIDSQVFGKATEEASIVPDGSRLPIEVPRDYTGTDLDEEHRVAYWREDLGINLHHWHWHLVYPFDGPRNIVAKDRRGELFYYMHQQILARYNFERLCNNMLRVRRMNDLRAPIPEAYFPKLDNGVASRNYPGRQPKSYLKDLNREADQLRVDISSLERWKDRILDAIDQGSVNDGQRNVPLTETEGIDILGNIMEASILSVNRNIYGDFHNMGHLMIAHIHDPDNRFLENVGIMGDSSTAMRDPVFYAWHAYINDILQTHKNALTPYTTQQLNFDGIRISSVEVKSDGVANNNIFSTSWQQDDINLARGMDFQPRGTVVARVTHLQHERFVFRIKVENSGQQRQGTVRIFLAPSYDEKGASFSFREQRNLFIELDRFVVDLKAGSTTIERHSDKSNVTIPYEQTFRDLSVRPTGGDALEAFNYCGCGWPDHVLIPRGTRDGFAAQLFVMISNAKDDLVQQDQNVTRPQCDDAQSYCGLRGGKWPDKKAMGYPFDRMPRSGVTTLSQFLTNNMSVVNVSIKYANRVAPSQASAKNQSQGGSSTGTRNQGSGTRKN